MGDGGAVAWDADAWGAGTVNRPVGDAVAGTAAIARAVELLGLSSSFILSFSIRRSLTIDPLRRLRAVSMWRRNASFIAPEGLL